MSTWKTSKIKVAITDYGEMCQKAQKLSGGPPEVLNQDETFYDVNHGIWKLRTNADSSAKLLSYDPQGPSSGRLHTICTSESSALDLSADDAIKMGTILMESFGSCGRVVKERKLYKIDDINIYIDMVDGIGKFIKIELVYPTDKSLLYPEAILKDMLNKFGISDEKLVTTAYYMEKDNQSTSS